jgi:arylsulfatase A-like enzyme/Tfp pilus assembly protein PilF
VATRPNILLITLDTTRADHIGAYGDRRARTPNLDRLAADGVLFERAISAAPLTLPAHVSLFTGLYPFAHGVRNNGNFTLGDRVPTLTSALRGAGYRTAAFVSAFVLDHRYGLGAGFDRYDDRLELERRGSQTMAAASAWLAETAQDPRPFFVWLHLYDPHDPYEPPPPFRDAFADRPYDGEIAYDDEIIGTLLAQLRQLHGDRSTLVAVAGDHGESLGEHGEATHGLFVYDSAVRIPMILSGAGRWRAGQRVPALVRSIDLAPTLLDAVGVSGLAGAQGRSLLPLVDGRAPGPGEAYSETYFPRLYMNWAALRSIQDDRWKFIDAPSPELYDLRDDARELANLAPREPARTAALKRAFDTVTGGGEGPVAPGRVDRDTAQKLAALGYIGAAADRPTETSAARRDPKAMIGVFNRLRGANIAIQRRQFGDAESAARAVLEDDAANAFATMILARAEMEQGRYRQAAADYARYAALVPTSADAHHWTAICFSRLGEIDRAVAEEEAALALDPRHAEAHELRGGMLASRGRIDAAVLDLEAAVDIAPDNVPFRVGLARALVTAHRLEDAAREIRRALDAQPENADALAASAALLVAQGQLDAARLAFARALARVPDADDVRLDYAGVLDGLGRRAEARAEYQRLATGRETPDAIRRAARARLR